MGRGFGTTLTDLSRLGIECLDGQPDPGWHGIARVRRQVHNQMVQLSRFSLYVPKRRIQCQHQFDPLAKSGPHYTLRFPYQIVEQKHFRLQHLFAAERQQLARQVRGSRPRGSHPLHVSAPGIFRAHLLEDQVRVAVDYGEQVVEIVRHAAGQTSDTLQPLGLLQLLLQILPLLAGLRHLG